jgi:hypothetical protein
VTSIPWCAAPSSAAGDAIGEATGDATGVASCASTGASDDSAINAIASTVDNDHRLCHGLIASSSLRRSTLIEHRAARSGTALPEKRVA